MIFTIDGQIGIGKTTTITALAETFKSINYTVSVIHEPVDKWTLLDQYYTECNSGDGKPTLSAYAFQLEIIVSKFPIIMEAINTTNTTPNHIIIIERDPLLEANVFAQLLYKRGLITDKQLSLIINCAYSLSNQLQHHNAKHIVLVADNELCLSRIRSRNRGREMLITQSYLDSITTTMKSAIESDTRTFTLLDVNKLTVTDICYEIMNKIEL
jgi:deoxyadenosine/deoxycytidine kinase